MQKLFRSTVVIRIISLKNTHYFALLKEHIHVLYAVCYLAFWIKINTACQTYIRNCFYTFAANIEAEVNANGTTSSFVFNPLS